MACVVDIKIVFYCQIIEKLVIKNQFQINHASHLNNKSNSNKNNNNNNNNNNNM